MAVQSRYIDRCTRHVYISTEVGHNLNYRRKTEGGPYTHIYTYTIYSTPPRSRSGASDAETGTKLLEGGSRQSLRHHISELLSSRHMENPHASKSHLLTHEVNVQLDVFRPAMMNGVGGEIHRRDVVAVDNRSLGDIVM